MLKQILHKILIAIFCFTLVLISSCIKTTVKSPFLLSDLPKTQNFEIQDHNFCKNIETNKNNSEYLESNLYWRCRLSLAKYRLISRVNSQKDKDHNIEISDLVTKISVKLAATPKSRLITENKKMNLRQHNECLKMGYVIATANKEKIDDYFACRRALIDQYKAQPPFNNEEYLKYPNNSYNISFVINERIDNEIKKQQIAKKTYPSCIKFNIYSTNFKRCSLAQDNAKQCFAKIQRKKFNKEWQEKIKCQELAYIRFPKSFLKNEAKKQEIIKRANKNSDYYNQNSLSSLGLSANQFQAPDLKNNQEQETEIKTKEKTKNINVKDRLYTKYEITRLRQEYITNCKKIADKKIKLYLEEQKEICENLKKFDLIKTN